MSIPRGCRDRAAGATARGTAGAPLVRLAALLLLFAGASPAAHAATYCLNPASNPSLFSRLLDWQKDSSGATTTLKLEQGTYNYSIIVDYRNGSTGDLRILGGYTAGHGCSDSYRSKDASTTVIDGGGANGVFFLAFETDVTVSVLTFANQGSSQGVFLGSVNSPGDLVVDHVVFRGDSIADLRGGSSITVKDVLVHSQPAGFAEALGIASSSGTASATNLTVADNHGGLRLGDAFDDNRVELFNAIVWNNAGAGVFAGYPHPAPGNQPEVYSSIVDVLDDETVPYDVSAVDPLFVNPAMHDYHLTNAGVFVSPAINAGTSAVVNGLPATDIEGHDRIIAGAPDIGVYETDTPFYSTYVVTTATDNGSDASPTPNSLRWALKQARADAMSQLAGSPRRMRVAFNLACPTMQVVDTAHPLPAIDYDVTIDATTNPGWAAQNPSQPGFSAALCVGINGSLSMPNAFHVVAGGRATIKGMRFGGFTDAAIRIDDSAGNLIQGNQIGGAGVGQFFLFGNNHDGVRISGTASGNFVGAFDDPTARNQVIDNDDVGVYIDSNAGNAAKPNYVVGNLFGLGSDGQAKVANGNDVYAYNSPGNVIAYNTISGATNAGVTLSGAGTQRTTVALNAIGLPETGANDVSNGTYAVLVSAGASNNTIGAGLGQSAGGNSIIADATGVYVSPSGGSGNRILANAIVSGSGLPVDLGTAGPTANDALDADTGANLLQNWPSVLHAHRTTFDDGTPRFVWIEGTLGSAASSSYRLDFYWECCAGASGRGMPEVVLGHASASTDAAGNAKFWVRLPSPAIELPDISLGAISATATDANGNTSEVGVVGTEDADLLFRDDFQAH